MPKKVFLSAALLLASCVGCDHSSKMPLTRTPAPPPKVVPLHREGTVSQYVRLAQGSNVRISGYGLVVGLGTKGAGACPAEVEKYLKAEMRKEGLGSTAEGTHGLPPERILRDKDTSAVLIAASIPPMAPVGTQFDIYINALPQTQTMSLEGGYLMPINMFITVGGLVVPPGSTKPMGRAKGSVLINPFLDSTSSKDMLKFREGRIPNGGTVTHSVPLQMVLREPDYARCRFIQRRLHERFPSMPAAASGTAQGFQLTIPREYRDDYMHFLDLAMHLPLDSSQLACEVRARKIAQAMEAPGSNPHELALVLEATGRTILPRVQSLYASRNPRAAFYAARTGLRLGDESAMDVVIHHATTASSPVRIEAIQELGHYPKYIRGQEPLQHLLDDANQSVRLAAYEALLQRGERSAINRVNVDNQFYVDLVQSSGSYLVYATQTGQPRIAVFGARMSLRKEVFFHSSDDLITINASGKDKEMTVYRKITRGLGMGGSLYSEPFRISREVRQLILTLGLPPKRDVHDKVMGLGVSYGQILGILNRMCAQGDIPGRFVLQPLAEAQRIYPVGSHAGRPNAPEK